MTDSIDSLYETLRQRRREAADADAHCASLPVTDRELSRARDAASRAGHRAVAAEAEVMTAEVEAIIAEHYAAKGRNPGLVTTHRRLAKRLAARGVHEFDTWIASEIIEPRI